MSFAKGSVGQVFLALLGAGKLLVRSHEDEHGLGEVKSGHIPETPRRED